MARYLGDKRKEYRYEQIRFGQGHYVIGDYATVKKEAQEFANKTGQVVAFQKWSLPRTKPILIRPKNSKFSKMTKEQIIADYKKEGYNVRNYGGR